VPALETKTALKGNAMIGGISTVALFLDSTTGRRRSAPLTRGGLIGVSLPSRRRQLVPGDRRHVRYSRKNPVNKGGAPATSSFLQVADREQGRRLFRDRDGDELVDRHIVALGKLPNLPM
jgi:hypothetical protein